MPSRIAHFGLVLTVCSLGGAAWGEGRPDVRADVRPAAGRKVQFNRQVRPILSENCFACHGPDKAKRKAGLRLDVREAALKESAIVPGKPDESELIKRLGSKHPDDLMPPPETRKRVLPAQREILRRWIAEGAEYQPHWAYTPVRRPAVPEVRNRAWVANPIDAFIAAPLEENGITPSPHADARTLLRRASLDVVGLPPSADDVRAFIAQPATDGEAWGRAVDALLASPHYGERMAVPWLDVVRYADTVGYHGDQNQHVFPYRDYVIDSFNRNKPFDQFTIEQIAGDLLPNPTTEQLVASGFNRLNMMTREGGVQDPEYLAKYMADRVRTVGGAWLGSTLGCAECHDHKYDPITAKDFYALGAFFADIKEWGYYADAGKSRPVPDLVGFGDNEPFPPEIDVPSPYLARRSARLQAERDRLIAAFAASLEPARDRRQAAAFRAWANRSTRFLAGHRDGWSVVRPASVTGEGVRASIERDGTVVLRPQQASSASSEPKTSEPKTAGERARIELGSTRGDIAALRLELLPHKLNGGTWRRDGQKSNGRIQLQAELRRPGGAALTKLSFHTAAASLKKRLFANGAEKTDILSGWDLPDNEGLSDRQASVWELSEPLRLGAGDRLVVTVIGRTPGAVRLSVSPIPSLTATGLAAPPALRKELRSGGARVAEMYLLGTDVAPPQRTQVRDLERQIGEARGGRAPTQVTVAVSPRVIRILPRGNWQDQSGAVVAPASPGFLPALDRGQTRRLDRLDLARWLVWRENPLTARTFVNRLWKLFFGNGLSGQLGDLGAQGEPPTHPELLDWLAAELMESGWDCKHMVRLLVTSNTYRQVSTVRRDLVERDPQNRLYARQSQRRLDAEFVRDAALAAAGLIDREIGGPSAFPYQPGGYFDGLEYPKRGYVASPDGQQYRRGLYAHWQRTFLHPMLSNFDAPSREECTADRVPSNTPQQALTLLNDPTFLEAARGLAAHILTRDPGLDEETRIGRAFEDALGRPPRADELAGAQVFLRAERARFTGHPDDATKFLSVGLQAPATDLGAVEHAAWTSLCRVILNLYDFMTRV